MRVGSLFTGYGGLDLAVGGELAWYAELDPAACRVMETHYPGVPNLGDVRTVDWAAVEPVDVITGGYPCQPFSTAGNRKGADDDRHLWPHFRDALSAIRPRRAVLENVRGHLTLGFADVLADLAHLGFDARWGVVRASDTGAPHHRARLFVLAHSDGASGETRQHPRPDRPGVRIEPMGPAAPVTDPGRKRYGRGQGPGGVAGMGVEAEGRGRATGSPREKLGAGGPTSWGEYAPAIHRWERITGRVAPTPTMARNGRDRLNPVFVEWMMGLPQGWVTAHGLTTAQELRMLGNGVVPQQAALALSLLTGPDP